MAPGRIWDERTGPERCGRMIAVEHLKSIGKEDVPRVAQSLAQEELTQLVEWLASKEDTIRYPAFLLLQNRSEQRDDVYPYWDQFRAKLHSQNSYQRNIGLTLIACNTTWDRDHRIDDTIEDYLSLLDDEKPITIRQCLQGLSRIVSYAPHLHSRIAERLMDVPISAIQSSMQKLILMDILNVLTFIQSHQPSNDIEAYIANALASELLDKKARKQVDLWLSRAFPSL